MEIRIIVNGAEHPVTADDGRSLLEVLRDDLGLTGAKLGCGEGACGACTVLIGRRAVTSCITPAAEAAGQRVTTVEGLSEDGLLHPVQQAWLETGAMQCGYCTPGWLTATAALLNRTPRPDNARIAAELAGNVCRCCTYPRILRAVRRAAELMEQPELLEPAPQAAAEPAAPTAPQPVVPQPAARALPWDQARDAASFFEQLPDGLVTVVAPEDDALPPAPGPGQLAGSARGSEQSAWVHVGADGSVTAFTGKVEAGQGTRTALGLLVAEELAVPAASVQVVMGNTDVSPFDLGTFGSRSMPLAAPPLRAAAAAARRLLRAAAAERFGIPAADLTVAGGIVAGPDGAPSIGYCDLLTGIRRVERVPADAPVTPAAAWRSAGHPARAARAADVVTGAKRFPADLRLDGMRHGCVLRAPAFGATLRGADTTAAEALPGVSVIRDGDFVGVVAGSAADARQAVEKIGAAWERSPQPAADDLADYLRSHPIDGEGFSAPFRHQQGDVDAALAAGPVHLAAHYTAAYIAHVPLEPRSAVAVWQDGHLTGWTGTSTPFRARRELAQALGVPEPSVHVIVPDYGGGFGGKHGSSVAAEAARLARAAGCPVKVQWSRHEEFHWGYLRPAALIDISSSADASGELTGWSHLNVNSGSVGILSPYHVPHQRIVYQPADSPLPQGSYRALAATANNFARESHMDELAHRLGTDAHPGQRLGRGGVGAAQRGAERRAGRRRRHPGRGRDRGRHREGRAGRHRGRGPGRGRRHAARRPAGHRVRLRRRGQPGQPRQPDRGRRHDGPGRRAVRGHRLRRRADPQRLAVAVPGTSAARPAGDRRRAGRPAGSAVGGRWRDADHRSCAGHRQRDLQRVRSPVARPAPGPAGPGSK